MNLTLQKFRFAQILFLMLPLLFAMSGCEVLENAANTADLTFLHENDYPEGTMSVSKSSYDNPASVKEVLMKASEGWCKMRGKVMVPISNSTLPAHDNQAGVTTFMFRAMNPSDPTINNPNVSPVTRTEEVFTR
jgi:hypothetical protein